MKAPDKAIVARAPALAPVVLRSIPYAVWNAFPLLSPLAAIYWRQRWTEAPELIPGDLAEVRTAVGALADAWAKAKAWRASSALLRRLECAYEAVSLPLSRAIATVLEEHVSVRYPLIARPVAPSPQTLAVLAEVAAATEALRNAPDTSRLTITPFWGPS